MIVYLKTFILIAIIYHLINHIDENYKIDFTKLHLLNQ